MTEPATALIVTESYWGNTVAVAQRVAGGLREAGIGTSVVAAAEAPHIVSERITLLLIGAPTHNMSLPNPASRRMAAARGVKADQPGVREWIESLRIEGTPATYAFDTHLPSRFSGSAARAITKLLRSRRIAAEVDERFLVAGEPPTLAADELDRAAAWATRLAGSAPR